MPSGPEAMEKSALEMFQQAANMGFGLILSDISTARNSLRNSFQR